MFFGLMALLFFLGLALGAAWGVYVYPSLGTGVDDLYAIQYKEGEWLWLKDAARREVLVYRGKATAQRALDAWCRKNPEYLDHSRIVPWQVPVGADTKGEA